jgi:hypothetical protein
VWLAHEGNFSYRVNYGTPSSRPSGGEGGVLDDVGLCGGLGADAAWGWLRTEWIMDNERN